MLTKNDKQKLIEKFGKNPTDSGSSKVQIALLTERIKYLTEHLTKKSKRFFNKKNSVSTHIQKEIITFIS